MLYILVEALSFVLILSITKLRNLQTAAKMQRARIVVASSCEVASGMFIFFKLVLGQCLKLPKV